MPSEKVDFNKQNLIFLKRWQEWHPKDKFLNLPKENQKKIINNVKKLNGHAITAMKLWFKNHPNKKFINLTNEQKREISRNYKKKHGFSFTNYNMEQRSNANQQAVKNPNKANQTSVNPKNMSENQKMKYIKTITNKYNKNSNEYKANTMFKEIKYIVDPNSSQSPNKQNQAKITSTDLKKLKMVKHSVNAHSSAPTPGMKKFLYENMKNTMKLSNENFERLYGNMNYNKK